MKLLKDKLWDGPFQELRVVAFGAVASEILEQVYWPVNGRVSMQVRWRIDAQLYRLGLTPVDEQVEGEIV